MFVSSRRGVILVALVLVVLTGLSVSAYNSHLSDYGQSYYYGQTAWPTIHRDPANSSFVPYVLPAGNQVRWTALDGQATLLAPAIGPEGNLYITTGKGPGYSHLHAFDRNGNLLWESAPQVTADDLDSRAIGSSPVVDRDGHVYVSDDNQFWAFYPDGVIKWVANLGTRNPFISAIITNEGYVGGITANGQIMLFNRADGSLAVPVVDLPGGAGPTPPAVTAGLWQGGLMDPAIIADTFAAFFGYAFEVVNTPAVSPQTGRIFITAAGSTSDVGRLYAIDIILGQLVIDPTFSDNCPMAGGSGTSPALSPDGQQIYAVDGTRVLVACDTTTGQRLWSVSEIGKAAAPAVGPDGTVYTGGGDYLYAINPDGTIKWQKNYNTLATIFVPNRPAVGTITNGLSIARTNSVITVSAHEVWVVLSLGYNLTLPVPPPGTGTTTLQQPRAAILVGVNPATGDVLSYTRIRDTNEGVISAGADGSIYLSHGSLLTSINYFGTDPKLLAHPNAAVRALAARWQPPAGLTALGPVSYLNHALSGINWIDELGVQAQAAVTAGSVQAALTAVQRARVQALATSDSIADAMAENEVNHGHGTAAQAEMNQVQFHLEHARDILLQDELTQQDMEQASHFITLADEALDRAVSKLYE